jgi:death-on-curing family protein
MVEEIVSQRNDKIYVLTADCIIHLHESLSKNIHLTEKMDPIYPPGVKNYVLLESAVSRQYSGIDRWLKYSTYFDNCATLIFGLSNNHAFHNGNKRVAFLSMIKHLYENGYIVKPNIEYDTIYNMMLSLANDSLRDDLHKIDRTVYKSAKEKNFYSNNNFWDDDTKIYVIGKWIKNISERKEISTKVTIKISKLREILEGNGITCSQRGTFLRVHRRKETFMGISNPFKDNLVKEYGIGNSLTEVGIRLLNTIRKDFSLTNSHGMDNNAFFSGQFIDQELVFYKALIYKLSKT